MGERCAACGVIREIAPGASPDYQYMVLDTNRVELRKARRWATREAIDRLKDAEIIEASATEINAPSLNDGGFTKLDFDPKA